MPRPIQALIHTDALTHNVAQLRGYAKDAKVFAVLKANAYGHGIERVYEALRGVDGFALLDIADAKRLRELGYRGAILLLEGVFEPRDLEACSRLQLWHVIHNERQIEWLAGHKTDIGHRIFLKLNSGMNRLGFSPQSYRSAYSRLQAMPQVEEISHMTHFANADSKTPHNESAEVAIFYTATQGLSGERSLCNSAALLRTQSGDGVLADWVRPGIALYGSSPDFPEHTISDWGLRPVMSLRSQIISIQNIQVGDSIGYGAGFTAQSAMRVGVVACGYADGYPRHAPTGTPVLVMGRRSQTLGRVSMDMLVVDLSHLPQAKLGAEVVLWGQASSGAVLSIDEVAYCAGTLGYELMCAVASRVNFVEP